MCNKTVMRMKHHIVCGGSAKRAIITTSVPKSVMEVKHRAWNSEGTRDTQITTAMCNKTVIGVKHSTVFNKSTERTRIAPRLHKNVMKVKHRAGSNTRTWE